MYKEIKSTTYDHGEICDLLFLTNYLNFDIFFFAFNAKNLK